MRVECVGLPGAGKSTLIRRLGSALRKRGFNIKRPDQIAEEPCNSADAPRYLNRGPDRTALFRLTQFRQRHRGLMKYVEHRLNLTTSEEFLFSLTICYHQACQEHRGSFDFSFMDEGFVHRGLAAHIDRAEAQFARYLEIIPAPDALLTLVPPVELAFERAIDRRVHKDAADKVMEKLGDLSVFQHRRVLQDLAGAAMAARGVPVLRIDSSKPLDVCVAKAADDLESLTFQQDAA